MNYESYHAHPINKFIHFICIPVIVLTSCNLLSFVKVKTDFITLELQELLTFFMLINYATYGFKVLIVMSIYFFFIHTISFIMRSKSKWVKHSILLFLLAWGAQFLGHMIEGNRPVLLTSITQAFTEAPLFSVSYILPFKITI
jgi:uncharacterized membrane protein YGL010W